MNDPLAQEPLSGRIASVYFNSFAIGAGNADFTIILKLDNQPIIELKASFTTAKTFSEKLALTVQQFERATSHTLMTAEETAKKLIKVVSPTEAETTARK